MLTKGKSGAWPGTNGGNSAAEQATTTMHQAVGLAPSEKGAAWQSTTTVTPARGRALLDPPSLLYLVNNDMGKISTQHIQVHPTTTPPHPKTSHNHTQHVHTCRQNAAGNTPKTDENTRTANTKTPHTTRVPGKPTTYPILTRQPVSYARSTQPSGFGTTPTPPPVEAADTPARTRITRAHTKPPFARARREVST